MINFPGDVALPVSLSKISLECKKSVHFNLLNEMWLLIDFWVIEGHVCLSLTFITFL